MSDILPPSANIPATEAGGLMSIEFTLWAQSITTTINETTEVDAGTADGQTLRWEATSSTWEASSALLVNDAGNVTTTGDLTCASLTSTGIDDNATSTAMTIDSAESINIGAAAVDVNTEGIKLGTAGVSSVFFRDGGAAFTMVGTASQTLMDMYDTGGNSFVGSISITSTNTAYNTSSDERMKTNFRPITNGLAAVKRLVDDGILCEFQWISELGKDPNAPFVAGVKAQAIYDLSNGRIGAPGEGPRTAEIGSVYGQDKDGNDLTVTPWGVDMTALIPHALAAINDLRLMVQDLETRVAALEAP